MTILYFGEVAEQTQRTTETPTNPPTQLSELLDYLEQQYQISSLSFSIAVNKQVVDKTTSISLNPDDEIAILPPFAGG